MSVKVVTLPGSGSLALDGAAVTANDVVAVADIPKLKYTPPANAHGSGYASFTFKVSDGVSESASANTLTIDVTAVDDPASGLAITGTARVGQTLTADTSNIVDADGLTSPNYRYQWVRVDGSTETDLGTASTHVVTTTDQGKKLKVEVTLTDDDSNTATLEAETGTVSANAAPTSSNRTVTMDEDTSYTFGSVDFAFTDTDSGDELVSVKVVTLPGSGSLALDGAAVTANDVVAVADIPKLKYTPAANAHGSGYASFTFKVSDGVSESASFNTLTINVTAVDDPASRLAITGTARVGQTLTADTSNIVDADGLTSPNYRYQWIRVDGSTETDLGTASTHVVTTADEGKKLKVEVTLTDDDSNTATLEAETGTVSANAVPTSADRTVTTNEDTAHTFGSGDFAFADTDSDDVLASVKVVTLPGAGSLALGGVAVTAGQVIGTSDLGRLKYTPPANAHGTGYASFTFKVSDGVSESTSANTMMIDVTAVNDPATGLPTITGTAREGQELTADAGGIGDVDGLPEVSTFAWQWLRVSGGSDTAIAGATSKTYRVVAADVGAKFKVVVIFTDLDGNAELVISAEYPAGTVSANAAPTSADRTVTMDEDTSHTFGSVDFAFTDTDSGDGLVSVKVVTLPGSGSLALEGAAVTANDVVAVADISKLKYTPPANAHGTGYASFTFKVSDGVSESASANTLTINVTAVDDPASGLAITGTVRVGQTLTADTSKIVDADGLTSPNYRYQWIRVDGSTETNLGTASTHVVTTADQGKKLKVEVTLTDDDSNTATLEAETGTVSGNAAPTSSNRTVTMDEDTSHTFGSVDFAFTDTDSGDGLVSVKVVTLPGSGSLALGGVVVTAGQVIGTSDLGRLKYTPPANAYGTGYASFTFKVSDGVSESASANTMTINVTSVNDPATGASDDHGDGAGWAGTDGGRGRTSGTWTVCPQTRRSPGSGCELSGGSDTAITGATSKTYRVAAADVGAKFKVVVIFTDLDGERGVGDQRGVPGGDGVGQRGADVVEPDGDDGRGHGVPVHQRRLCLYGHGQRGWAGEREGGDVAGIGESGAGWGGGDGERRGGGGGHSQAEVHTACERARYGLRLVHVQGKRRGIGERVGQHDDDQRDGGGRSGERSCDITGTVRVGQTLTADTSKIADADGLTSPNYRYQWVRVDGSTETDLGTASTHVVTTADEGKKLKVEVTLTDDDSNTATLEAETGTVSANATSCREPALTGRTKVWSGTINVGEFLTISNSRFYGWFSQGVDTYGTLSGDGNFRIGNSDHEFSEMYLIDAPLRPLDGRLFIDIGSELTTNQKAALQLHICESKFNFSDATDLSGSYTWDNTSLDWAGVSNRNLILSMPTLPTLTLTLTPASISESDDADTTSKVENRATVAASLSRASTVITTVTISVESADSNDYRLSSNAVLSIPNGALSSLGVVTIEAVDNNEDEADKELTVKGAVTNELGVIGPDDITLTIIDDDNAVPTSANRTVTMDEDTSYTFGSVDFAFTDTDRRGWAGEREGGDVAGCWAVWRWMGRR